MKHLWCPWRTEYIHGKRAKGCIFCRPRNYLIFRGKTCFVILNRYPYNSGHLMIIPYRHTKEMERLTVNESEEMFSLVQKGIRVLKRAYKPDGFNIGVNLGRLAGAGIAGHLHLHLVPRWGADTNFMPVLGDTRTVPEHLEKTAKRLKKAWKEIL